MPPRKPIDQQTPEQQEATRSYNREAKRKSRAGKPPEIDKRLAEERREYWRLQKRKQRLRKKQLKLT